MQKAGITYRLFNIFKSVYYLAYLSWRASYFQTRTGTENQKAGKTYRLF